MNVLDKMQAYKSLKEAKEFMFQIFWKRRKILSRLAQMISNFAKNLRSKALAGLWKLFEDCLELKINLDSLKFAVIATIRDSKFKLLVLSASSRSDSVVEDRCKALLVQATNKYSSAANVSTFKASESSESAEYHGFTVKRTSTFTSSESEIDVIRYLNDPTDKLSMLRKYPFVKNVFVHFNPALPSSAPVERMLILTRKIHSPSQTLLISENFRELLVLKANFALQSEDYLHGYSDSFVWVSHMSKFIYVSFWKP